MSSRRNFRLMVTFALCLVISTPLFLLWLVNLDLAISAVHPQAADFGLIAPQWFHKWAVTMAADFSTVSTLVPLLIFLFPLMMSMRIIAKQKSNADYIHALQWDPYPPQFPFFLVMLGLTGTLYGLFIGLGVSGVADLGEATATADTIRATIDRLLDGTATALLSSLVGLIGAFLAARPLTWAFRRAAGVPAAEDHQPLSDTLAVLNRDLGELSRSSREFSEQLGSLALNDVAAEIQTASRSLDLLQENFGKLNQGVETLIQLDEKIVDELQNLSALKELDELRRLRQIEELNGQSNATLNALRNELAGLRADGRDAGSQITTAVNGNEAAIGNLSSQLEKMMAIAQESQSQTGEDRAAMKKALAKYLAGLEE